MHVKAHGTAVAWQCTEALTCTMRKHAPWEPLGSLLHCPVTLESRHQLPLCGVDRARFSCSIMSFACAKAPGCRPRRLNRQRSNEEEGWQATQEGAATQKGGRPKKAKSSSQYSWAVHVGSCSTAGQERAVPTFLAGKRSWAGCVQEPLQGPLAP
jgi:hypothetical protein